MLFPLSKTLLYRVWLTKSRLKFWCSLVNSNHWPFPYQGSALPTELRERGAPVRDRTDFSPLQKRTSSVKGFRGIDKNKGGTRLPLNCYGMEYSHNKGRLGYTYASIKLDTICFSIARSVHKNPVKNGRDVMWYVNVWLWHTSLPIQKKLVDLIRIELIRLAACKATPGAQPKAHK